MNTNEFYFELDAKHPAAFVWLETPIKGRFSHNGFLMYQPNVKVLISKNI